MDYMELLGSKARLQILRSLSREDMYVSEIIEEVGMDGKTAKHHLNTLEEAGVLGTYEDGRRIYYTLLREVCLEISPSPDRRFVLRMPEAE
jgi:predicted transcriptional regulator